MKKITFILFVLLSSFMVFGNESISIGILNGPSSIPTGYMMDNQDKYENVDYVFEKFANPSNLLPKLIKKEIDIGFLPVNVAAKVFNSSNGSIVCCCITGNGNISLVTKDSSIKDIKDLKNKKVYVAGQGATPDYLFRYLLKSNNIEIRKENDDYGVILDFSIPTASIAPELLSDKITYAVVPEPFISVMEMKSNEIKVPIDFQQEYKKITGKNGEYPLTVMVATKDFVENKSELLDDFLDEYEDSFEWTVENPAAAGKLSEKYQLGFSQAVANRAIPKSNYCFIEAEDGIEEIEELLKLFLEYAPQSIGGKLPEKEFYYIGD